MVNQPVIFYWLTLHKLKCLGVDFSDLEFNPSIVLVTMWRISSINGIYYVEFENLKEKFLRHKVEPKSIS
jgi:hypothetical protein